MAKRRALRRFSQVMRSVPDLRYWYQYQYRGGMIPVPGTLYYQELTITATLACACAVDDMDNLLANSMVWSVARPYAFRVEADFVTCTQ